MASRIQGIIDALNPFSDPYELPEETVISVDNNPVRQVVLETDNGLPEVDLIGYQTLIAENAVRGRYWWHGLSIKQMTAAFSEAQGIPGKALMTFGFLAEIDNRNDLDFNGIVFGKPAQIPQRREQLRQFNIRKNQLIASIGK